MGPIALRHWRLARGISREELARLAAVSPATVSRVERGTTRPRPHVAHRLAAALGTEPGLVAELAEAIPRLGGERAHPAAGHDRPGRLIDEEQLPADAFAQEGTHEGV